MSFGGTCCRSRSLWRIRVRLPVAYASPGYWRSSGEALHPGFLLLYWGIYWLNQFAVRKTLGSASAGAGNAAGRFRREFTLTSQPERLASPIQSMNNTIQIGVLPFQSWFAFALPLLAGASGSADSAQTLEAIRKKHDLPALAVVVVKDGRIRDRAAVGDPQVGRSHAGHHQRRVPYRLGHQIHDSHAHGHVDRGRQAALGHHDCRGVP